ncbi:hypothetical protein AB3M93_01630 [Novosphingobium panipatense]|uniref:hypothetical protein n=1 Tax=Novosphingobium TaxID=165696 RepID=UPI001E61FECE|nr:hypothetical protein [Novosphingobium sp. HII-3]
MRVARSVLALALVTCMSIPAPLFADDPRDAAMTPEAIAKDAATIRRLNREQLDYVRRRDAGYAQGWRDHEAARDSGSRYARDRRAYEEGQADYAAQRRQYERDMRAWRKDVAACNAGNYNRCAR